MATRSNNSQRWGRTRWQRSFRNRDAGPIASNNFNLEEQSGKLANCLGTPRSGFLLAAGQVTTSLFRLRQAGLRSRGGERAQFRLL